MYVVYRWLARRLADVSRVHTIQYTVIPVGISYSAAISSLRPPSMRRVRLRSTSINIYLYEYSCSVFIQSYLHFQIYEIRDIACHTHRSRICHLIRSAPSADVAVSEYPIAIQLYRVYTYITTAYYKYIPTPRSDIAQCRHNIAQEADATGTVFVFDSVHPIRHRCRPRIVRRNT